MNIVKHIRAYAPPVAAGLLTTLSQPTPFDADMGFLAWIALAPFLFVLPGMTQGERLRAAVAFGFAHYATGLYWLPYTLNTFGNVNMIGSVFLGLLLALAESAYAVLFALLLGYVIDNRPKLPLTLTAPVLWVAVELLRARTPFGGFPWMLVGYSQEGYPSMIQIADITGVFGVSFAILVVNSAIAEAYATFKTNRRRAVGVVSAAAAIFVLNAAYGFWRVSEVRVAEAKGTPVKVSLLQGNISQDRKWDPAEELRIVTTYRDKTVEAANDGAELIVWPEAAVPFAFERDINGAMLNRDLARLGTHILLGSPDYTLNSYGKPVFTNSAYLISQNGVVGKYSKIHLVPFSEGMPYKFLTSFVDKLTKGMAGVYDSGKEYTIFNHPKGKFGVIICYEAIFGELTGKFRAAGAELLVNITNDAWFGDTSAPRQHLAMSAFRCAENHVYLVRAANTGISAVVDPTGRILSKSGIDVEARLDAEVRFMPGSTFYARHGDLFAWLMFSLGIAVVLSDYLKNRFGSKKR